MPGQRGEKGERGEKGIDGRDGRDGIDGRPGRDSDITKAEIAVFVAAAVEEGVAALLKTLHLEGRTLKLGDVEVAKFPLLEWRGVFKQDQRYEVGDVVVWGGSSYVCDQPTSDKPDQNEKAWKLIAKKGRDAR